MKFPKINLNQNTLVIIYKLLYDALFLFLFSLAMMLIAEGALPGLISDHISLLKIALAALIIMSAIVWLGKNLQFTFESGTTKKSKLMPVLILFTFLLIGNSLLKFAFWENLVITTLTLIVLFILYNSIFSIKNKL